MNEQELIDQLTEPERWIYQNSQMIADRVFGAREKKVLIPKSEYKEEIEDEIIALFFYIPNIEYACKAVEGILLTVQ